MQKMPIVVAFVVTSQQVFGRKKHVREIKEKTSK
jgi:hypothetical protein